MSIKVTWHGHATFSIQIDETLVLVDPFLNGNPVAKTKPEQLNPQYILVTHGHGDHVADVLSIAQRSQATIIGTYELCSWFEKAGAKTHAQNIGGSFTHSFGQVKMTPAWHSSSMPDGQYAGMPAGFVITAAGKRIYIAGDTALFSDMSLIGRGGLDLAILPIGDNYTMGPEDSVLAIDFLKPKLVIPCHYNTFGFIKVDVEKWASRVTAETAAKPIVLTIDESYTL